ncbi:cytochrome P450 [Streptomyces sp. N2-109]|uniref:Cytochrome P450 n=1 Tax=Streptomyces gossypii TaxID=2883101 RepID=A0ABT2K5F9_9ACTN|nr:cytochrome P450 [Streptomyces gossypii]MCT2594744.1 cytochrome P450 [Streptomyces gossypii]
MTSTPGPDGTSRQPGISSTTASLPVAAPLAHEVIPLYGAEFAADPYSVYDRLREYGPLAPVEIAPGIGAMLVTDYRAALELLHDPDTWSKDSRAWQATVPPDSPVLPMMGWRPNALVNDGDTHRRYRQVITESFSLFTPHELREHTRQVSETLIARFTSRGQVDLIAEYAAQVPVLVFNRLFGMPDSYSAQLVTALCGMLDANTPEEAVTANEAFSAYIGELIGTKQVQRGADLTSWYMDHPAGLTPEELASEIVVTMAAGHNATTNLIGNALARMLSDNRYYSTLSSGGLTPRDALHDVLQNDPPMSNLSPHFPTRDVFFHGTWIRAGQLVLISYAAANTQHGRTAPGEAASAGGSGGGAHLAWSAGPHACPVQNPALLIATTAIERLTAWLSDIELTVPHDELVWRHGPFHRGLVELPARFTPITPDQAGATPWASSSPSSSTQPDAMSTARPTASAS